MQKKSKKIKTQGLPDDLELLSQLPAKVDFLLLKDRLKLYKNARKKIFDLAKKGYLQSIQKGLYFNSKSSELKLLHVESFANSLYFPSYVSAEWALQYYGLLTDRVHIITSVTTRRSSQFKTPVGTFAFDHIHKKRYAIGYSMQTVDDATFLIARPEKALLDYVNLRAGKISWKSKADISLFLEEDLRLDTERLLELISEDHLKELIPYYHRNAKEARLLRWMIAQKEGLDV